LTQELEVELQQANVRRTRAEKLAEDYRAGIGTEQERTALLLTELQKYLSSSNETRAFKQLLNVVDALKISSESYSKIDQVLQNQVTVEDLNVLTESFKQINLSITKLYNELTRISQKESANSALEREVLVLIKKELGN
jgi:uncharacterized alpha-E superfamily protein